MIERKIDPKSNVITPQPIEAVESVSLSRKFAPRRQVNHADLVGMLQPPQLQFNLGATFGRPKYEEEALRKLKNLKMRSSLDTTDMIDRLIFTSGQDIQNTGSLRAQNGLRELHNFISMKAAFEAMSLGLD